jgi:thymidylate kinase
VRTICITGPDGAGKTTLLNRLQLDKTGQVGFLKAPVLEAELFLQNERIHKVCLFINWLYAEADNLKVPQLRSVALLASMLIYDDLLSEFEKQGVERVICDRHPFVDTAVYGRFYAHLMDPNLVPVATLAEIDYNFNAELFYFTSLLGLKKIDMPKGALYHLLQFMYNWFCVDKKFSMAEVSQLFKVRPPDEILYLRINPEVLRERVKQMSRVDAHNDVNPEELISVFDEVVKQLPLKAEEFDANSIQNLDALKDQLKVRYLVS